VHLVGFIIRIYHDARSSECQIRRIISLYKPNDDVFHCITSPVFCHVRPLKSKHSPQHFLEHFPETDKPNYALIQKQTENYIVASLL